MSVPQTQFGQEAVKRAAGRISLGFHRFRLGWRRRSTQCDWRFIMNWWKKSMVPRHSNEQEAIEESAQQVAALSGARVSVGLRCQWRWSRMFGWAVSVVPNKMCTNPMLRVHDSHQFHQTQAINTQDETHRAERNLLCCSAKMLRTRGHCVSQVTRQCPTVF